MNKSFRILILLLLTKATTVFPQKQIAVEDFTTRQTFNEKEITGINWMKDGKYYSTLSDNKIIKYDVTTGRPVDTLLDGSAKSTTLAIDDYSFTSDEQKILLLTERQSIYRRSFIGDYYVYDLKTQTLTKLSQRGKQSYATFSPDGSKVAFVRNNNLFYTALDGSPEEQVTDDGQFNYIINGTTDWVYEEEFSFVVGFEWSPDSKKLAYYRFDESEVKEYNLQLWRGSLYPIDYRYKYPKAGEKNSTVEIWFYDLSRKQKVKADLGREKELYIPSMKWTADPNVLSILTLNRLQNKMVLLHAVASTGETDEILAEGTNTYLDIEELNLTYLKNGQQFILVTETDGYKHLYLYSIEGRLLRKLTTGDFEISEFLGLDETTKKAYYISTEVSPLERHLYSISLDGKKKTKLSSAAGTHQINMSSDFQFYIDHHSSAGHPDIVTLYNTKKNSPLKLLEENEQLASNASEYGVVPKEFFTFKTPGEVVLNGFMLKPQNFDPSKKYPVLVFQYSGPGSQEVENAWAGSHFYFHQVLTQKGYIVAVIDPRGTGGRGESFKKITYKQLGKYELEDHLAAGRYLGSLHYIDETRMGIWGWSYGGYMSALAMTKGAGVFKIGMAVSPVTNWRFYDTIYTERYLQTPKLNPDGYDMNSPLTFASSLSGKFLLIHGTGDDNVHFQNSIMLEDAFINATKQFDSFYYPDKDHGIEGGITKLHLYTIMLNFIQDNL